MTGRALILPLLLPSEGPFARSLEGGGTLTLRDPGLDPAEHAALFDALRHQVPWKQERIRIAGREYAQPRLTAWFGDPGAAYTYSGLALASLAWSAGRKR